MLLLKANISFAGRCLSHYFFLWPRNKIGFQMINYDEMRLLSSQQAANYLGISAGTLDNWRCNKSVQIPYIKLGRSVKYVKDSLDAFIKSKEAL